MIYRSKFENIAIPQCNILSYLFPSAEKVSTKPFLIDAKCPDKRLSLAELLLLVKRFASGLDKLKVPLNSVVLVFSPNHLYVPVAYLAAVGSRRYYTGANPAYTVEELSFQISIVEPTLVLIHPSLLRTALTALTKASVRNVKIFLFDDEDCTERQGICDWKDLLDSPSEGMLWKWDEPGKEASEQIATINFSSGTTGLPKGVCISHHNIVSNALQTTHVKFCETSNRAGLKNEKWLAFLPLYHAFSQLFSISIASRLQVTVYIMKDFDFASFLDYIQRYQITTIQAVPPIMNMLAKRPETSQYDISSLRNIMVGAAPMPLQLSNELTRRFGFCIARGWGMTETTCVGMLEPDNVRSTDGNSGYLLPNTEAKIVDSEGQEIVNTAGELWIRGPQTTMGCWRNEKATRDGLSQDGWIKTGDIVVVKDEKWYIIDRIKELIKVNGLQVAPAELEALLLQHELVTDAAVVGLAIDGFEYPRAYVVPRLDRHVGSITEAKLEAYISGAVAKHKRLTGGVKFVKEILRLQSGKIMRVKMKELAKLEAASLQRTKSNL